MGYVVAAGSFRWDDLLQHHEFPLVRHLVVAEPVKVTMPDLPLQAAQTDLRNPLRMSPSRVTSVYAGSSETAPLRPCALESTPLWRYPMPLRCVVGALPRRRPDSAAAVGDEGCVDAVEVDAVCAAVAAEVLVLPE